MKELINANHVPLKINFVQVATVHFIYNQLYI